MSLHFKNLILKNYGIYQDAELDLDYEGVTLVTGRNIEASGEVGTNYCGKSLLVSAIPGLLYGSAPTVNAQKASAKHDAFRHRDSGAHLALDINGIHTEIERYRATAKSLAMSIDYDGENLEFGRATAAEEWLAEHLPLKENLFYASSYLFGTNASPLIEGTTKSKFHFICSLFGLDVYDDMKAFVNEERNGVKLRMAAVEERNRMLEEVRGKIDLLYEEFNDCGGDLEMAGCDDRDSRTARIEEYMEQVKAKQEDLRLAREVVDLLNSMALQGEPAPDDATVKELMQEKAGLLADIDWFDAKLALMQQFTDYARSPQVLAIERELDEADADYEPAEFQEWAAAAIAECKARSIQLDKSAKSLNEAAQGLTGEAGVCPTCRKPLTKAEAEKIVAELLQRFTVEVEKLRGLQQDKETADRHVEMMQQVADFKEQLLEGFEEGVAGTEPEQLKGLRQELLAEKQNAEEQVAALEERITLLEKADEYRYAQQRLKEIGSTFSAVVPLTLEQAQLVIDAADEAAMDRQAKELWKCRDIVIRIAELEAQEDRLMAESDEDLADEARILDILLKVCGSDGIRRTRCESVLEHVMATLNRNASFVFPEEVEFAYEISPAGIEILCNGANIRTLSGAESRFFNILVTSALLELIDDSKRTNLMVLDEMDAFSGGVLKRRFYSDLVPILAGIVPHVIIVTPNPPDSELAAGCRRVCAVRENGIARLEFE